VASLSQGRTAAAQCGLFTHKSVPVIFEPPCIMTGFFLRSGSLTPEDDSQGHGFHSLSQNIQIDGIDEHDDRLPYH